jgi:hypothetical protein
MAKISPRFLLVPVLGLLVAACSDETRSKVVVDLELGRGVLPPQTIRVSATQGPKDVKNAEIGWGDAGAGPDRIGIFFPDSVSGPVTIAAKAYNGNQMVAEGRIDSVTLKKGASVGPFSLVLNASTPGPDGGVNDGGGDGSAIEVGPKDAGGADTSPPNPSPDGESIDGGLADTSDDAPLDPGVDGPILVADGSVAGDTASPSDTSNADGSKDVQAPTDVGTVADTAVIYGDTLPMLDATLPSDGVVALDATADAPSDTPTDEADTMVTLPDAPIVDAPDAATPPADTAANTDAALSLAWQPSTNIQNETYANRSYNSSVAIDPLFEHVYVAWNEVSKVKVRRWNRQTATWEATVVLQAGGDPFPPVISADAQGNVMVLWPHSQSNALNGVWVSSTSNGTDWSTPKTITTDPSNYITFALARNGKGHAAYTKYKNSQYSLRTAYYDGTDWTEAPNAVEPGMNTWETSAQLALGDSGDGLLIFARSWYLGGTALSGLTFTPPIYLDPNQGLSIGAYDPKLAVNRKGEGIVIWTEPSNDVELLARRYDPSADPSARWSSVSQVVSTSTVANPAVALDEQGTATVVWQEDLPPSGALNLKATRGPLAGSWGQAVNIETDNTSSLVQVTDVGTIYAEPKMAPSGNGDILLAWHKDRSVSTTDVTYGVYAARYTVATNAWSPQVQVFEKAGFGAANLSLAVADSGMGAAAFIYYNETATDVDPDTYNTMVSIFR